MPELTKRFARTMPAHDHEGPGKYRPTIYNFIETDRKTHFPWAPRNAGLHRGHAALPIARGCVSIYYDGQSSDHEAGWPTVFFFFFFLLFCQRHER